MRHNPLWGGCTHAWWAKIARHQARKKQGGGAPRGAKHPGEKKFWPPGEAIFWDFWAKSPPGLLNKHPTEKNFSPPGGGAGEKIFRPPKAAGKFFWGHPPVSTPPLSQNPCPPMINSRTWKRVFHSSSAFILNLFEDFYYCFQSRAGFDSKTFVNSKNTFLDF